MKNFILIGSAGYIAPRHMQAIKDNGCNLIASYDPHDNVGILDSYFPDSYFFTEFEILDRFIERIKLEKNINIDYVSICSPNYLHDSHIRYGLRIGANVICEKPVVLNPWNVERLIEREDLTENCNVNCILQLRQHKEMRKLKEKYSSYNEKVDVNLEYITSRGNWYLASWKNNIRKSGGLVTNIGIHFFDSLIWLFGDVEGYSIKYSDEKTISGHLILERANVQWTLSIDENRIPKREKECGKRTHRIFKIGEDEFDFSQGFTDLHSKVYKEILEGRGNTLKEAYPSIKLVSEIRKSVYGI